MRDMRSNTMVKAIAATLFALLLTAALFSLFAMVFISNFGGYDEYFESFRETPLYEMYAGIYSYEDGAGGLYLPEMIQFMNTAFEVVYPLRAVLPWACAISSLAAIALLIFLFYGAGHRQGREGITLSTIDRIPFDLFTLIIGLIIFSGFYLASGMPNMGWFVGVGLLVPLVVVLALVLLLFLVSLAARLKAGGWLKNTLVYKFFHLCWRIIRGVCVGTARGFSHGVGRVAGSLPLLWKLITGFCVFTLVNSLLLMAMSGHSPGMVLFWLPLTVLVFAWLCHIVLMADRLKHGAERLAAGDLETRIDTAQMHGELLHHAENLNNIGLGLSRAVEARIKSERMKTELITNVSHDIKTPLTSIINYVDLLKKEQIDDERIRSYIEVLDRQSKRLKKLTEDVLEASKASTGNIAVELARTEVTELLNQVAGEYAERFAAARLTPVIDVPEEDSSVIMADGRLLWRVFDNLLNNICKYSQPDTRVYFSVRHTDNYVMIAMKNISRDVLNISSDELIERFVRGDSARSSEGSGLGLSIAQSLTELQGGSFELFVDGDLFKAVLTFPRCS